MKYGNISTGSEDASLAAKEILKFGGNAFDAAVSAIFVSMTSEFALTGAYGGGTLLGIQHNSSPFVYDFFVDSPINTNKNREFINVNVNFGETSQGFNIGKGSIATPGNLMGLIEIQKQYGVLDIKDVLQHAIYIANHGVAITSYQGYILSLIKPILEFDTYTKTLLFKDKKLINKGDTFKNPDFANFLEQLSIEGDNYLYKNRGSSLIIDFMKDGGLINKDDLLDYQVIERKPLITKFYDKKIITNPPPSNGGSLISFILNLLSNKLKKHEVNKRELIFAMRLAQIVRKDINVKKLDIKNLFNKQFYNKYSDIYHRIIEDNTYKDKSGSGSTTHVSIVDSNNNCASITTSNGAGSGYIVPDTGIMMNNMLGEEDLNPKGFHSWDTSKRMQTMMSPTIISGNLGPELILGSGGSNRIRSAIQQVIINYYINQMDLKNSINSPRLHLDGKIIQCEKGLDCQDLDFKWSKVNQWDEKNLFFGGVNAVTKKEAVGDHRRDGYGLIC